MVESIVAMMIKSIVARGRTLLMSLKFPMMMWCSFVGRGMNVECDQVKRGEALKLQKFSWLDLPTDVVELIISNLQYEDKAKLACVCKSWSDMIRKRMHFYPVGQSPLLIHVKTRGEEEVGGKGAIFHYHSLWLRKAFQFQSTLDLTGCEIISAKDGTLLVYNKDEMQMRMVDPLDGCLIDFPSITSNISFNGTAIGLDDDCYIIFLIDTSHEDQVTVHLFDDEPGWALNLVYDNNNNNEPFHLSSNPVYLDGRFYCLGSKGDRLGVFDLLERTWNLCSVKFRNKYDDDDDCRYYLVDWIDTVMAVRVKNCGGSRIIRMFVLDLKRMVWEETDDLCGRSLFLGSTLSFTSLPTAKKLQNRVFLPHCHKDKLQRVIVAEPRYYRLDGFYFMAKLSVSWEDIIQSFTPICCCNKGGEESPTIWYEPFYKGLDDD